jgi:hypothetical protein
MEPVTEHAGAVVEDVEVTSKLARSAESDTIDSDGARSILSRPELLVSNRASDA